MDGSDRASFDLVALGEGLVAFVASDGRPLPLAERFERHVAGSELNVAVGVARSGHRAAFGGRVGADASGEAVLRQLRAEKVDTRYVTVDPGAGTAHLMRDVGRGRAVEVQYARAGAAGSRLAVGDSAVTAGRSARAVFVSGITPMLSASASAATDAFLAEARDAGAAVYFDPNVRTKLGTPAEWRALMLRLAPSCDTVLLGDDELELVGAERGASALFDRGVGTVVVRRGRHGAWATDGTTTTSRPSVVVPVVDPVGAGDAFTAGWIAARLEGVDLGGSLERGLAGAAGVVSVVGDLVGIPLGNTITTAGAVLR